MERAIEDGVITLDEENALARYPDHFGISTQEVNANVTHTSLIQAEVIRDVTQGIVPQRQRVNSAVPFNPMKSETPVWVIQDVNYLETVVHRERRGTSHGVSIRVAREACTTALSTVPEQARRVGGDDPRRHRDARAHDQAHLLRRPQGGSGPPGPVRQDCGLRALQRWVLGIMRDAQTAKPQTFRDRRRLVRLQPGRQPGPVPELSRGLPAPPEIQQQGRGGCGSSKVTWPQQLLRTSRPACQATVLKVNRNG